MNVVVEILHSGGETKRHEFPDATELLIGRDPSCQVCLPESEPTVSARHVRLVLEHRTVRFEDVGSANGTFVDGKRTAAGTLAPGQALSLGQRGPSVRVHFVAPTVLEAPGVRKTTVQIPTADLPLPQVPELLPATQALPAPAASQELTRVGSRTVLAMISQAIETARRDEGLRYKGTVFFQEIVRQTVQRENRGIRRGLVAVAGLVLVLGGYMAYTQVRAARLGREASALIAQKFEESISRIDQSASTQAASLNAVKKSYEAAQAELESKLRIAEAARSGDREHIAALRSELITTRDRADEISAALLQTQRTLDESKRESNQRIADVRAQSRTEFKKALSDSLAYLQEKQTAYLVPPVAAPAAGPVGGQSAPVPVAAPTGTVFIPSTRSAVLMKKRLALDRVIVGSEVEAYGVSRGLVESSIRAIVSETLASTGRFELAERADLSGIAEEKSLAEQGLVANADAAATPLSAVQVRLGLAVTRLDVERRESTSPGWGTAISFIAASFGSMSDNPALGRDARAVAAGLGQTDIRINDQVTDTTLVATVGMSAMLRDVLTGEVRTVTAEGHSSSTKHSYAAVVSSAYAEAVRTGRVIQPKSPLASAIADCAIRLSVQVNEAFGNGTWRGRIVSAEEGGPIILSGGTAAGLRVGDTFRVSRRGTPLKEPSSGEILGYTSIPVGVIHIEKADERTSICRFGVSPQAAAARGDDAEFIGRTIALKEGEAREDLERRIAREGIPASFVQVASRKTKLYPAPSTDSSPVKAKLSEGQIFPVIARFGDWYQVTLDGKPLYVAKGEAAELQGMALEGVRFQVARDSLDVLAGPRTGLKKVGKLPVGTTVEPSFAVPGWLQARLPEGLSGWVPESGLTALGRS